MSQDAEDQGPENEGAENGGAEERSGGQVSEVSGLEAAGAGEPIMPDQATSGAPDAESGEVQEGTAGPNARPRDNRPGESRSETEEPHTGRPEADQPA